jgi:hypothetical protein
MTRFTNLIMIQNVELLWNSPNRSLRVLGQPIITYETTTIFLFFITKITYKTHRDHQDPKVLLNDANNTANRFQNRYTEFYLVFDVISDDI